MKVGKLFLCVIASAALLAGCKETEENLGTPKISVNETSLEFDETGGAEAAKLVSITSSRDWSVSFDPEKASEWLTVTPDNGGASAEPQEITIYPDPNTGVDRTATIIFSTSTVSTEITVKQTGTIGDPNVYFNNFDKTPAEKIYGPEKNKFPYLDQSDCWQNQTGSGSSTVTYDFASASARNNLPSNDGAYEGSGTNNILFGSSSYLQIKNISLSETNLNYTLSFGAIRNQFDAEDNTFKPEEFHVYISDTGEKWVELEYAFPDGFKDDTWDLASSTFTLPEGTTTLYLHFSSDLASSHRIDDVSLAISTEEGTKIDFSQGIEIGQGGDDPEPGDITPYPDVANAIYYNDFDKEVVSDNTELSETKYWQNEQGSGIANVTYAYDGADLRKSSPSNGTNTTWAPTLYEGSGDNNIFFNNKGSARYFQISNIKLGSETNYTLYFGAYGSELTLSKDNYTVYISDNGERWVALDYAFPDGAKSSSWDLASATFTVPSGTSGLYVYFGVTETSKCRLDDIALVPSGTAGTAIDFSTGGPIGGGETPEPEDPVTIDEIYGLDENESVSTEGQVTAIGDSGFILTDKNASIFVYGAVADVTLGETVKVSGTTGAYNNLPQIADPVVEHVSDGSVSYPEPTVLNGTNESALINGGKVVYVTYTGTVTKSENNGKVYYNFDIDGGSKSGSVYAPAASLDIDSKVDQEVVMTGYYVGNYNNYLYVLPVSVETTGVAVDRFSVSPLTLNVSSAAGSTSFDITANVDWTVVSDNADFTVSDASGNGNKTVTVSYTANEGAEARTAKITVSTNADVATKEYTVTVNQSVASQSTGDAVVLNLESVEAALGEMGNGSYGDYKDVVVTGQIDGVTYSATNICANPKDGTVRLNGGQFIQVKGDSGYITNSTEKEIKSLKVYTLSAKDADFAKTKITVGTEENPSSAAIYTTSVEQVSVSGYDGDTNVDINVYTVDVSGKPTYFKVASSAAIWLYKIEVEY